MPTSYGSSGQVAEQDGTRAGTFPVPNTGYGTPLVSIRPEVARGRVFCLSGTSLLAYNPGSFALLGSVTLPTAGLAGARFVRFGTNGIAYRTATQVLFVRSKLIGD